MVDVGSGPHFPLHLPPDHSHITTPTGDFTHTQFRPHIVWLAFPYFLPAVIIAQGAIITVGRK